MGLGDMGDFLDFVAFFSAIILFPFYAAAVAFQFFCIVWGAFASSKCAAIARRKGWDASRYGRVGFVYSTLLFVPWLHLVRRMEGRKFSLGTNAYNYTLLYSFWLVVIVANAIVLIMTVGRESPWGMLHIALVLFAVALGVPAWIVSLLALIRRRSVEDEKPEDMQVDDLPERVYLMPFVWASANILALPVMLILGIIIGLLLSAFF